MFYSIYLSQVVKVPRWVEMPRAWICRICTPASAHNTFETKGDIQQADISTVCLWSNKCNTNLC